MAGVVRVVGGDSDLFREQLLDIGGKMGLSQSLLDTDDQYSRNNTVAGAVVEVVVVVVVVAAAAAADDVVIVQDNNAVVVAVAAETVAVEINKSIEY